MIVESSRAHSEEVLGSVLSGGVSVVQTDATTAPELRPWTEPSMAVFSGVPVDDLTLVEAVQRVDEFVRIGRSTGRSHQVATVNLEFLVNAGRDEELLAILQNVDLSVPDGMPLVWGSRLFGAPLRQRVAGADLVPAIADLCCRRDYKLMFFGAGPGVAQRAAAQLRSQHPGLNITGVAGPSVQIGGEIDGDVVDVIRSVAPDILCVAMGNPKQEHWIAQYRNSLGVPVLVGVGGTFDLLSGNKQRAPRLMQRTGTEWLFRLVQEPRRLFRRYALCVAFFVPLMCKQVWAIHAVEHWETRNEKSNVGGLIIRSRAIPDGSAWRLSGADCEALQDIDISVDLTRVQRCDKATVAMLFVLHRLSRSLTLEGVSPAAMQSLERRGIAHAFAIRSVSDREHAEQPWNQS